jgi:hypothetical protein
MNKVLFIGNFAGGSFGCPGDPCRTFPYYALTDDVEAFEATRESAQLIAFDNKADAERRLAMLARTVADQATNDRQARSDRQYRHAVGRSIRTAIELYTGAPIRTFRWTDQLRPVALLAKESAALLRNCPSGGYDALADGRTYRIWIGASGQARQIVELTSPGSKPDVVATKNRIKSPKPEKVRG